VAAFAEWQPRYAERGVATFPVTIGNGDKKPSITGYLKTGLRGSSQLALKFPSADSFGFACGACNGITIVDLDDTDPAIIREGERLFGVSPLHWRTGGGKFALAFRHNREGRRIRCIPTLPIDLLGGGFVVAPPSAGLRQPYEIIKGSLADLDRLPIARIPEGVAAPQVTQIQEGERNAKLFQYCNSVVFYCDDIEQLIDAAETWAAQRLTAPLSVAEIRKTCGSVWKYRGGRKRIINHLVGQSQWEVLIAQPDILGVLTVLSAENGPDAEFMIADGLGEARGWPRRLVPNARAKMLELGLIERIGRKGRTGPYLYRWRTEFA
jgi:hypothetical protein